MLRLPAADPPQAKQADSERLQDLRLRERGPTYSGFRHFKHIDGPYCLRNALPISQMGRNLPCAGAHGCIV